ncbi:CN hydrolase domain-containing protein [Entamoeba marina]
MTTISLIQSNVLVDILSTLSNIETLIRKAQKSDVYVLPELFTSGYCKDIAKVAHKNNGEQVIQWMMKVAEEMQAAIVGSIYVEDNGKYFNRMLFVDETGVVTFYNKTFTSKTNNYEDIIVKGQERVIVHWRALRYLLIIGEDIFNPMFLRNLNLEYDVILCSLNISSCNNHMIPLLCGGRACEDICFCVCCNRIGTDEFGNCYLGNSCVYNYWARDLAPIGDTEGTSTFSIDLNKKQIFHKKLAFKTILTIFQSRTT